MRNDSPCIDATYYCFGMIVTSFVCCCVAAVCHHKNRKADARVREHCARSVCHTPQHAKQHLAALYSPKCILSALATLS